MHLKGFPIESCPMTDITRNINIGQELHFDLQLPLSLTGFTATAMHIERESAGFVTSNFTLRHFSKQFPDFRQKYQYTWLGLSVGFDQLVSDQFQ